MGGVTLPAALLAGIISFASPCFLPVVPVFAGYIAGRPGPDESKRGRWRLAPVTQAVTFIVAFSLVFMAMWVLIGLIGWVVGDYRNLVRVIAGSVLVLLGLHTAGLIRLPFLERSRHVGYSADISQAPTYRRSFLLGLAFGAGWTPCIGPVLAGILGLTTTTDTLTGACLLVVYCLGLGIPFVLVCAGIGTLAGRLAWFSRHQAVVDVVIGALLMGIGFLMITDLLPMLARLMPS